MLRKEEGSRAYVTSKKKAMGTEGKTRERERKGKEGWKINKTKLRLKMSW